MSLRKNDISMNDSILSSCGKKKRHTLKGEVKKDFMNISCKLIGMVRKKSAEKINASSQNHHLSSLMVPKSGRDPKEILAKVQVNTKRTAEKSPARTKFDSSKYIKW